MQIWSVHSHIDKEETKMSCASSVQTIIICDHICINQHLIIAPYGWFMQIWSHTDKEEAKMSCASVQTIYVTIFA